MKTFKLVVDDLKSAKDGLKAGESLELVAEDLKCKISSRRGCGC